MRATPYSSFGGWTSRAGTRPHASSVVRGRERIIRVWARRWATKYHVWLTRIDLGTAAEARHSSPRKVTAQVSRGTWILSTSDRRRWCSSTRRRRGCARRRRGSGSLRRSGSGSLRRSGSGSLAGSAGADEIATALRVPRTVLAEALTARSVGSSLTDAKRSQRAPNEGSTHQPKGLTSREGAISQSSSQLIEEAFFFSGHRLPPPIM